MKKLTKKRIIFLVLIIIFLLCVILLWIYTHFINKKIMEKPTKVTTERERIIGIPMIEKKKLQIVKEDSNKRPICIMIDTNVGNNSHIGLQDSYINYEIIVEGGLTRIMALYKDKDLEVIGPVRSSRHYYLDYALEHDCIYTHFGWSPYAQNDISVLGVNNINGLTDSKPFWRDYAIAAPHNVFTSTQKIYDDASERNYKIETLSWKVFSYSVDEINLEEIDKENIRPANHIDLRYSYYQTRSYDYNSEKKVYLRNMNSQPHTDKNTKEQLNYKNIIIQKVNNFSLDSEGRQDLNTVGEGEGYFVTNGQSLPIHWKKTSRNDKTIYTYINGTEMKLNDGNTFVQIVPTQYEITIE